MNILICVAAAIFHVIVMLLVSQFGYRCGYKTGVLHGWHIRMFKDEPRCRQDPDMAGAWKVADELEANVDWKLALSEDDLE